MCPRIASVYLFFYRRLSPRPTPSLFPYTTLFRSGPLFIQGDHVQVNAKKYAADPEAELKALRALIEEELHAGFYNVDIDRSEEHTSELQSPYDLVCRLLLEKKKKNNKDIQLYNLK